MVESGLVAEAVDEVVERRECEVSAYLAATAVLLLVTQNKRRHARAFIEALGRRCDP